METYLSTGGFKKKNPQKLLKYLKKIEFQILNYLAENMKRI